MKKTDEYKGEKALVMDINNANEVITKSLRRTATCKLVDTHTNRK